MRVGRNDRSGWALAAVTCAIVSLGLAYPASGASPDRSPALVNRSAGPLSPRLATLARPSIERSSVRAQSRAIGLPASAGGSLLRRPGGEILVRLRLTDLSNRTRAEVVATGATFVADGHDGATATVAIAVARLDDLAAVPSLRWAQEELTPHIADGARIARSVARAVVAARSVGSVGSAATCPTGITSEGDTQLEAVAARAASSVNGTGVKVGILSDSYNALGGEASDVANGELPGPANPCGYRTAVQNLGDGAGTDEGRAMAQIVHDLAPGASLAFRTAFNGQRDFANGIRALRDSGPR